MKLPARSPIVPGRPQNPDAAASKNYRAICLLDTGENIRYLSFDLAPVEFQLIFTGVVMPKMGRFDLS